MTMKTVLLTIALSWAGLVAWGQAQSAQSIRYMLTFNAAESEYTAWVVPNYSTPNANNPEAEERGATAQFALRVSATFSISQLIDLKGQWDKNPFKLTKVAGLSPDLAYYVIGKAPQETNYGSFRLGEPVALFRFKGSGSTPDQVQVLGPQDPVIGVADKTLSLNISNSFYSRSGQRSSVSARPLEQFEGITTVASVMKQLDAKNGGNNALSGNRVDTNTEVLIYPNPTTDEVIIRFFSPSTTENVQVTVIDEHGRIMGSRTRPVQVGLNTLTLSLGQYPGGMYSVKTMLGGRGSIRKIHKF